MFSEVIFSVSKCAFFQHRTNLVEAFDFVDAPPAAKSGGNGDVLTMGDDETFRGDGVALLRAITAAAAAAAAVPLKLKSTEPKGVSGGRTNAGKRGLMSSGCVEKVFCFNA